jgi:ribosomal small subunit protein bTHX
MGRGDKKSRKGKQWKGSFGVSRNKNAIKARLKRSASQGSKPVAVVAAAAEAAPKAKRTPKKKAEA